MDRRRLAQIGTTEGFLIENTSNDNLTVRFSGKQYSEGGADKSVVLYKWNYNEPWNSSSSAAISSHIRRT